MRSLQNNIYLLGGFERFFIRSYKIPVLTQILRIPSCTRRAFHERHGRHAILRQGFTDKTFQEGMKEYRNFSSIIVRVLRSRLRSVWKHIQALKLIDPLGPDLDQYVTPPCGLECPARSLCSSRYRFSRV